MIFIKLYKLVFQRVKESPKGDKICYYVHYVVVTKEGYFTIYFVLLYSYVESVKDTVWLE